MLCVTYAQVIDDKDLGVYIAGVFFAGLARDKEEADRIARDCVNSIKNSTIIPRIIEYNGGLLTAIMKQAEKKFDVLQTEMAICEQVIERPRRR